ncbi:MAG: hypothetical protein ACI3T9_04650 [Romboutsia timonensis]
MLTYVNRFTISMTVIGYIFFIASTILVTFLLAWFGVMVIKALIGCARDNWDKSNKERLQEHLDHVDDDYLMEKEIYIVNDILIELTPVNIILDELDKVNIW